MHGTNAGVAARGSLCLRRLRSSAQAQVSPAEINDPQLKAAEKNLLPADHLALSRDQCAEDAFSAAAQPASWVWTPVSSPKPIHAAWHLFIFRTSCCSRFPETTTPRTARSASPQNQRASQTFSDVIAPILSLVTKYIPADVACDGIGFEIAYHVRTASQNFDYEGKEILVVVFSPSDAFAFAARCERFRAAGDSQSLANLSGRQAVRFGVGPAKSSSISKPSARPFRPAKERAVSAKADAPRFRSELEPGESQVHSAARPIRRAARAALHLRPRPVSTATMRAADLPATPAIAAEQQRRAGDRGGRRAPAVPIPGSTRRSGQRGTSQISFCRLRSAVLCRVPRPSRLANDSAQYAALRGGFRLDLQTRGPEF